MPQTFRLLERKLLQITHSHHVQARFSPENSEISRLPALSKAPVFVAPQCKTALFPPGHKLLNKKRKKVLTFKVLQEL